MKMRSATAALASVVVLAATQAAAANRLASSSVGTPSGAIWRELTIEAGGLGAHCAVTLGGSLEVGSIAKRAGTRFGVVSEATLGTCTSGAATVLRETLPWAMTYNGFGGTLPNITSVTVNLIGAALQVEVGGITCLARTESAQPARGIANVSREAFGELVPTEIRADETAGIETTGGFFCSLAGRARLSGTGTLSAGIGIALI